MSELARRVEVVDGDVIGPSRRRVSMLTEPITPGELRKLFGREVLLLTRSQVRHEGVLVDVRAACAVLLDGVARPTDVPLDEILAIRVRRGRSPLHALVALLLAKVTSLERRVADLEPRDH